MSFFVLGMVKLKMSRTKLRSRTALATRQMLFKGPEICHLIYSLTTKFKIKRDANIMETQLRVLAIQIVSMTNLPSSKSNVSLCSLLVESNADECKSVGTVQQTHTFCESC